MKTLFRLLIVAFLIGGWALSAAALHVIYSGRITLIPKDRLTFTDTYLDTRAWTLDDVAAHPAVVNRIIETGKAEPLLAHLKDPKVPDDLETQLRHAMDRGPAIPATNPIALRIDW
jgi:hypothetical protein